MADTLLYFAYGSNLHPLRLGARVPSARLIGVATLAGHTLRYHKRGTCGSGKCNAYRTGDPRDHVLGALYRMADRARRDLDRYEGGGYAVSVVRLLFDNAELAACTYLARDSHIDDRLQPFHWYRDVVAAGAAYHGFPEAYLDRWVRVDGVPDPDSGRHAEHARLLQTMRG